MNSIAQPLFKADKGGNMFIEGAFLPVTAAIHGIELAGDQISQAGYDFTGKTFKFVGTAGIIWLESKIIIFRIHI